MSSVKLEVIDDEENVVETIEKNVTMSSSAEEVCEECTTAMNLINLFGLDEFLFSSDEGEQSGKRIFNNGNTYEGDLRDGVMHGKGKFTWKNTGVVYMGDFENNEMTGSGRIEWTDGRITLKSVISLDKLINATFEEVRSFNQSFGKLEYDGKAASCYEGDWYQGQRHGYGIHQYPEKATYEGHWESGKRHGEGTLHWSDRDEIYTGSWVDGKQYGLGCHAWHILRVRTTQYSLPNVYDGQWVNGERHGLGTFHYPNGSKYVGYWKNNLKHGRGTLILKDGRIFERAFIEDRLEGPDEQQLACELKQPGLDRLDTRMPLFPEQPIDPNTVELHLSDTSDCNLLEHYLRPHLSGLHCNAMELRIMQNYITTHLPALRCIYQFYGRLGIEHQPDNTIIMRYNQFCQFIKDCHLHRHTSMAALDRIIAISYGTEESDQIQNPERLISFGSFLNILVILACNLYTDEECHTSIQPERSKPSVALARLMTEAVLKNACKTSTVIYGDREKTRDILLFMEPTYNMYRFMAQLRCKDLHMLSERLTVRDVVKILCTNNPVAGPCEECDLNTEALVHCAVIDLNRPAPQLPIVQIVEKEPSQESVHTEIDAPISLDRTISDSQEPPRSHGTRTGKSQNGKRSREKKKKSKDDIKSSPEIEKNETPENDEQAPTIETPTDMITNTDSQPIDEMDDFTRWKMHLQEFFIQDFLPAFQRFEVLQRVSMERYAPSSATSSTAQTLRKTLTPAIH